jgi:hypothetical protein
MAEVDRTSSSRGPFLLQNAVEDIIALEHMKQCDDSKTTCSITDPLTYQFALELREPECSTHKLESNDGEYRIKMDIPFTRKNGINSFRSGKIH